MEISIDYVAALDTVRIHAENILDKMKESPGGDCYEFTGSMNDIEVLRDALKEWEILRNQMD